MVFLGRRAAVELLLVDRISLVVVVFDCDRGVALDVACIRIGPSSRSISPKVEAIGRKRFLS